MPSAPKTLSEVRAWLLAEPPLEEVAKRFPMEWSVARKQLADASKTGSAADLINSLVVPSRPTRDRRAAEVQQISDLVRGQLILRSLRSASVRAESGVQEGRVRFGLLDGWVLQRLFFARDLVRKPVSSLAYSVVWPLSRQRRRLMPLVRPRGIYCFYSSAFVRAVGRLAAQEQVLEIAAGDGTLSRFLREAGHDAIATDDFSWQSAIDYGNDVEKLDAAAALRQYSPSMVLCSWPPPRNSFEKAVFETPSVQTYVVVTSANPNDASDWRVYAEQGDFENVENPQLSRMILPRGSSRVLVFTRKPR